MTPFTAVRAVLNVKGTLPGWFRIFEQRASLSSRVAINTTPLAVRNEAWLKHDVRRDSHLSFDTYSAHVVKL